MNCRACGNPLHHVFIDLGTAPPSNAYVVEEHRRAPEIYFPLRVLICDRCWLLQTEDFTGAESLFTDDYAYFSSMSDSWLEHCREYTTSVVERFALGPESLVAEIAANDGYLLQFFVERGIPCYGVEPTAGTAGAARGRGIDIVEEFFTAGLASTLVAKGRAADLIAAKNVLAHVPDINDFVAGFACLLKPSGVATFEFPHLYRLVEGTQFDTIYHEHFSYLSLGVVDRILTNNGLTVFDVEEHPTHGGSLRVFARRTDGEPRVRSDAVGELLETERVSGMETLAYYRGFQARAETAKDAFVRYLIDAKHGGLRVAAYGAAAKGATLVNFAGIRPDLIGYVVDRNPHKQGKYLPGSRIPIVGEDHLRADRPDRVIIFPWNIASEVLATLDYIGDWGGRCVRALPTLEEL